MDSTSIITQASREEEQLTSFPPDRALTSLKKPRHKGFLNTLLCCFGAKSKRPNPPIHAEDSKDAKAKNGTKGFLYQGKYLLPQIRHQDAHKMCLVIDLDETLVHSSFKPISNADFIVPVEIDGVIHQVYVLKRPYVDEFLQKMGEMYECVLFTASLAKVKDVQFEWGITRTMQDFNNICSLCQTHFADIRYADPVADLLDKWGVFRSRLFRESCVFYRGNYVKDLGRLGRELHKVIIVDNSPASYIFHPDNAVPVNSWFDDMSDTELRDLIPFFEQLSKMDDVYSVLRNSNHAAGSHPQPNTLNGSHFISPQIQHVNGFMQPS